MSLQTPEGGLSCLQRPGLEGAHPSVRPPNFKQAKCHLHLGRNASELIEMTANGDSVFQPATGFIALYCCCCIQISDLLNTCLHEAGVVERYPREDEIQEDDRICVRETGITDHPLSAWPFLLHCGDNTHACCSKRRPTHCVCNIT